jgi:hypothetical protein
MPWNEADRAKYDVIRERYSSDLSDEEFALISLCFQRPRGEDASEGARELSHPLIFHTNEKV